VIVVAGSAPRLRFYALKDFDTLPPLQRLSAAQRQAMKVVAHVLPFRANNYVVDELIDWDDVPDDPIFQLTFPQPEMLDPEDYRLMSRVLARGADVEHVRATADAIRMKLNPHPAGQLTHNVPTLDGEPVPGLQHKYAETCLVFPSAGQTCHAYCTFCFRWAQFVGMSELKLATDESMRFREYLRRHGEVSDVLLTGGDPMVMSAKVLARYVEPLLSDELAHIQTIRIGTKVLAYWPYRVLGDADADELLRLFEKVVAAGKHLTIMAHFVHWKELGTPAVRAAIRRLQSTGAVIRTQAPLVRHVNDDAEVWARMWHEQVRLGLVPYYMFVERDTGAARYFSVPLHRALAIYRRAAMQESGLGRTARGPAMSALPGKVTIDGIAEIDGRKLFVLSFLQARNPDWCKRPFFAEFDPRATWLSELRPAFGAREFFYERELRQLEARAARAPSRRGAPAEWLRERVPA
jgi:KamA family protein